MRAPAPLYLEDHPAGVEPGTAIARLKDLPDHGGLALELADGDHRLRLLIQQYEGEVLVFENRCPHAGTPLNLFDDRFLDSSGGRLICRTHGALFDPVSGKCVRGPCKGDYLRPVAIEIEDGTILAAAEA